MSGWANLTSDTTDVGSLNLKGVTILDGMMTKLELYNKYIEGPFPDFSKNTALQELEMNFNNIIGEFRNA
jgi:hypothetical protein